MNHKVSILIPTKDRIEFIIRQLKYYIKVKSIHKVYIGDSSKFSNIKIILDLIKNSEYKLELQYFHWPALNDRQALKQLGEVANEEYCAYCGDDDYLIPVSLTICAKYLANNKNIKMAQGRAINFSIQKEDINGKIDSLVVYWNKVENMENSALKRFEKHILNYWVPQFSVHRTKEYNKISTNLDKIKDRSIGELFHNFLFILSGKAKFIDCLYLIRQTHPGKFKQNNLNREKTHEYKNSYDLLISELSNLLSLEDKIDYTKARLLVEEAYFKYLEHNKKAYKNQGFINFSLIKTFIQNIFKIIRLNKFSTYIYLYYHNNILHKGDLSFKSLMNKSSKYNKDFIYIYYSILNNNNL